MSLIEQVVFEQRPGKSGITTPGKGTANEEVIKEDCTTVFKSTKKSSVVETVERGGWGGGQDWRCNGKLAHLKPYRH